MSDKRRWVEDSGRGDIGASVKVLEEVRRGSISEVPKNTLEKINDIGRAAFRLFKVFEEEFISKTFNLAQGLKAISCRLDFACTQEGFLMVVSVEKNFYGRIRVEQSVPLSREGLEEAVAVAESVYREQEAVISKVQATVRGYQESIRRCREIFASEE